MKGEDRRGLQWRELMVFHERRGLEIEERIRFEL